MYLVAAYTCRRDRLAQSATMSVLGTKTGALDAWRGTDHRDALYANASSPNGFSIGAFLMVKDNQSALRRCVFFEEPLMKTRTEERHGSRRAPLAPRLLGDE